MKKGIQPLKAKKSRGMLIIDDNDDLVDLVELVFADKGFSRVSHAYNGEDGLRELMDLDDEVLVIVLGLGMPKLDGFGVMQQLQATQRSPIGIIMWTGQDSSANENFFFSLRNKNVVPCAFVSEAHTVDVLALEVEKAMAQIEKFRGE